MSDTIPGAEEFVSKGFDYGLALGFMSLSICALVFALYSLWRYHIKQLEKKDNALQKLNDDYHNDLSAVIGKTRTILEILISSERMKNQK